jgi:hypothetical protein
VQTLLKMFVVPLVAQKASLMYKAGLLDFYGSFSLVKCECGMPLRWDKWSVVFKLNYAGDNIVESYDFRPLIYISSSFYFCDSCKEFTDYPDDP